MKLYNTLTRKKEEFIPIKENYVSMYACGPTVYDYIHVGNARPAVVFDTLRRYFIYRGYDIDFVVNFTDVDDKIIKRANERGVTSKEIAEEYIRAYEEDAKGLNLYEEHTKHPKATEFIKPMVDFIEKLIEKDAAYNVNGNVYFNIDAAKDYGKLSKKSLDDLLSGARVDINDEKRNPADFALWKKAKEGEPSWDSPWGEGRPGWHIECSVMSQVLLGDTIDIHAGGSDLQFPHHENEIAQSETLTGKTMANYWLHNGMLTVDDTKMSKSLGNFFTVKDISKEYDLEVLRFFLLSTHYRNPINFSRDIMDQTKNGLERLYTAKDNMEYAIEHNSENGSDNNIIKAVDNYKEAFIEALDDDFNTADAISSLFDLVKYFNTNIDGETSKSMVEYIYNIFMELANVIGILYRKKEMLEEEIIEMIEKRSNAREDKNYQLADEIREELLERGILLEDTADGVKWKRL